MSKAYMNDFERSQSVNWAIHKHTQWSVEEMDAIQEAFINKGHCVLPVSRVFTFQGVGYDFDALIVDRYSRDIIEEHLFRQRIEFYARAESGERVALIMINETPAEAILKGIRYLPKNKRLSKKEVEK